jgi:hypothetical protein
MRLLAVLIAGCASGRAAENPLSIAPADFDFSKNPKLLERIRSSPHGYFRFINLRFSEEVCRRFAAASLPAVNLHGDAHVEQYAVTDLGRGLTDFDDSSVGPFVVDLSRLSVSLRLLLRARGWRAEEARTLERFAEGYTAALEDPSIVAPEPRIVKTIASTFRFDRSAYLQWIDSMIDDHQAPDELALIPALAPYVAAMRAEHGALDAGFFDVLQVGHLTMGIGSALDLKYLVRLRGPSDDPTDDVVLEAKEVQDLSGVSCIRITTASDPFRILVGQSRIAYEPYEYLGYVRMDGRTFWIHSWVDNYRELDPSAFEIPEDVVEVAYDIGVQLGRGHPKQIATPLDAQLRRAIGESFRVHRAQIDRDGAELTDLVEAAWTAFREGVRAGT